MDEYSSRCSRSRTTRSEKMRRSKGAVLRANKNGNLKPTERAPFTNTVTPRRSKSGSSERSLSGSLSRSLISDEGGELKLEETPRDDNPTASYTADFDSADTSQKTSPKANYREKSEERDTSLNAEKRKRPLKKREDEADTADEVSDIESELASPRKADLHLSLASEPGGVSPRFPRSPRSPGRRDGHCLSDLPEEQDAEEDESGGPPSRGREEDVVKMGSETEARGGEEAVEKRVRVREPTDVLGTSKRKSVWQDSRAKAHSSSPQRTPRTPRTPTHSLSIHGMDLSDASASTADDFSQSDSTSCLTTNTEMYSKLAQKSERAPLCDEPEGSSKGYTLSSTRKEKIIKRHRKKQAVLDKRAPAVVEVEIPMRIPKISLANPPDYQSDAGKKQLEMVPGIEPSSTEFLQDNIYILEDTTKPKEDNAGQENKEKPQTPQEVRNRSEEGPSPGAGVLKEEEFRRVDNMPTIVIVPAAEPKRVVRGPLKPVEDDERGCEDLSQIPQVQLRASDLDDPDAHVESVTVSGVRDDIVYRDKRQEKVDSHEAAQQPEKTSAISIVCSGPDSPPASVNNHAEISISGARRRSVELGMDSERVVLAKLQESADDLAAAPQQGQDCEDRGRNLPRRRSSLLVPLDAETLKLSDRWVSDEDLHTQPHSGADTAAASTENGEGKRGKEPARGADRGLGEAVGEGGARWMVREAEKRPGEEGIRVYASGADDSVNDLAHAHTPDKAALDERIPLISKGILSKSVRVIWGPLPILSPRKKDDQDVENDDSDSSSSSSSSGSSSASGSSSSSSSESSSAASPRQDVMVSRRQAEAGRTPPGASSPVIPIITITTQPVSTSNEQTSGYGASIPVPTGGEYGDNGDVYNQQRNTGGGDTFHQQPVENSTVHPRDGVLASVETEAAASDDHTVEADKPLPSILEEENVSQGKPSEYITPAAASTITVRTDSANQGEPDSVNQRESDSGNLGEPNTVNQGEPDSMNRREPNSVNRREPDCLNQGEPDLVNQVKESVNQREQEIVNQGKPTMVNQGEPDPVNRREPDSVNRREPDSLNQGDPHSVNQVGEKSVNQREREIVNQREREIVNQGEPNTVNQGEPVLVKQREGESAKQAEQAAESTALPSVAEDDRDTHTKGGEDSDTSSSTSSSSSDGSSSDSSTTTASTPRRRPHPAFTPGSDTDPHAGQPPDDETSDLDRSAADPKTKYESVGGTAQKPRDPSPSHVKSSVSESRNRASSAIALPAVESSKPAWETLPPAPSHTEQSDNHGANLVKTIIIDAPPTVLVTYPDTDTDSKERKSGEREKKASDVDQTSVGERSESDSACVPDSKMSDKEREEKDQAIRKQIEEEERGKGVYVIPTTVLI